MTPNPGFKESGNVFIIILVAVALFAALGFTMSRGMRSDTTTQMSDQRVALSASTILTSGQKIERAVSRLRRKGISENDISFDQSFVAGYNHGQPDTNKVFNPTGGSISWQTPPENANDGSDWLFTGATCIAGMGAGATGCDTDTTANEELIAVLPNLLESVCSEINDRLEIAGIPADTGGGASTTQYVGAFADGTEIILAGGPFNAACYSRGGSFTYYQILIER
jgi:hypothetical protein